jgi:hypothetical protein
MSRWKRLRDLDENLSHMSVERLQEELAYFRKHAKILANPARKAALKRVYEIEKMLTRKLSA